MMSQAREEERQTGEKEKMQSFEATVTFTGRYVLALSVFHLKTQRAFIDVTKTENEACYLLRLLCSCKEMGIKSVCFLMPFGLSCM